MIYEMKLKAEPFEKIEIGRKTVELRLFDEKRRRLDIGDKIIFEKLEDSEKRIAVVVKSLHRYATFEDLFMDIPLEKCGNASTDTSKEATARMSQYYTEDQIQKYGVLGIGVALIDLDAVLKELDEQKEAEYERLFPDGMK